MSSNKQQKAEYLRNRHIKRCLQETDKEWEEKQKNQKRMMPCNPREGRISIYVDCEQYAIWKNFLKAIKIENQEATMNIVEYGFLGIM